jgi:hypothetical protein
MKKYTYISLSVVIAILVSSLSVMAIPTGSSNIPSEYFIKGRDLSWLSIGIYGGQFERDIKWDNGGIQKLKSNRWLGYVGADVLDFITVYAQAGQSDSSLNDKNSADAEASYGAGVRMNLLSHFIREPTLSEDIVRINLGANLLHSSSDLGFKNVDWDELSTSLTLEIVNNTKGNKFFNPESISLYIGPVFSKLISSSFSEDNDLGIMGGMEIFIVDTVVLDFEVQHFDQTSFSAGINFRF